MEKVKRTKVVDLLKSTAYGSIVNVKGWVRTHRSSKAVDFIALNDGSTINNIQIVVDPSKVDENQLRQITTGAKKRCHGTASIEKLRSFQTHFQLGAVGYY